MKLVTQPLPSGKESVVAQYNIGRQMPWDPRCTIAVLMFPLQQLHMLALWVAFEWAWVEV